jgi:hypothetical protein
MVSLSRHKPQTPHVMATFNDGAYSFMLSRGATFAELAAFIEELALRHDGAPVAVNVQFDPAGLHSVPRQDRPDRLS